MTAPGFLAELLTPGLLRWLADRVPGLSATDAVARQVQGGRSNLTVEVSDGVHTVVVRRPPLGHVPATAHDMLREHRVMSALAGSAVPVPSVVGYCADTDVFGAPFLATHKASGVVLRTDNDLAPVTADRAATIGHHLVDVLADLHTTAPGDVGLADFGRPDGYLDRQLRRWAARCDAQRERDLPDVDRLGALLSGARPAGGGAAIVHGDYRLDNVLVGEDGEDRTVSAVLDWELATLGDPLADLGTFCMYWDGFAGLGLTVPCSPGACPGWPSRDELVRRYADRRGIATGDLGWYLAFGYYRIAVILEGVHQRHRRGLTVGGGFDGLDTAVPHLAARGIAAFHEDDDKE